MEHTTCLNGEVCYNILYYRREQEVKQEDEWTKRLTKHGRRCIKQLLGHVSFRRAFEDLLDFPGLWRNVGIGTLYKMISMRCDEKVDSETVRGVELRCPKYSTLDEEEIRDRMRKGEIFGSFSREERDVIWEELRSIGCLIPSLVTFFKDLNYLQACADGLKHLITLPRGDMTVRQTLEASFLREKLQGEQYVVEVAEDKPYTEQVRAPDRLEHG
ncbi:hypothetical protein F4779DRAFT_621056 [Xylariaceae sp. FL0662B]|nr:hypothetical protein F4779DRAFT_621056 [Xylariaceae sp. FL0662B]